MKFVNNKKLKNLYKYYRVKLKYCAKRSLKDHSFFIVYLATYLQYSRDKLILEELDPNPETNLKLASICVALAEYEQYITCIYNYYKNDGLVLKLRDDLQLSDEEILRQYQTERLQHWDRFCELCKINLESWLN